MGKVIDNTLFIGDLHEPFCLDEYLGFNRELYKKHKCKKAVFIGDLGDNHAISYHEHDPDGYSPGDERKAIIKRLNRWYKAFPDADALMGNHDDLVYRKGKTAGLSRHDLKDYREIIKAPATWRFHYEMRLRDIMVIHGSFGNAFKRAMMSRISTIQGHLHSEAFVQWGVSEKDKLFGLQIGCGIDRKAYAFAYGKDFVKKPVISSGLLLDNGRLPIIELMNL